MTITRLPVFLVLNVLLLASVRATAIQPEDIQTILVPKQTVTFSGGGGSGGGGGKDGSAISGGVNGRGFTSYCIEEGKLPPGPGTKMVPVGGSVRFILADKSKLGPMPLAEAIDQKLLEITPPNDEELEDLEEFPARRSDGFLELRLGDNGQNIQKASFEPGLFVAEGASVPEGELVPEFSKELNRLASKKWTKTFDAQDEIWNFGPQLFYRKSEPGVITYTKPNRSTAGPATIRFPSNSQGGTAILITDPEGNLVVIDTAFGKASGEALAKELCAEAQRLGRRLLIFATHPDEDHIAALRAHFKDAPCVPSQIIRPLTIRPELRERFEIWSTMMPPPMRDLYRLESLVAGLVETAVKTDAPASRYLSEWRSMETGDDSIIGMEAWLEGEPATESLLRILRWREAKTSNEHSLVTQFQHNEVITMQLGDANERVIKKLMEAADADESEISLRSHVLVWPHHQWCPPDADTQEFLLEFLEIVRPQIIMITQPKPGVQEQSKPRLENLLKKYRKKNPGTIIHWLEKAEAKVLTYLEPAFPAPGPANMSWGCLVQNSTHS